MPPDLFPVEDKWAKLRADFAHLVESRPIGGYKLMLTDWPWEILMRSAKGYEKSPQRHYRCIPTDIIKSLPAGFLAAPDSVLLQWSTWPMMEQQLEVMKAHGFTYKSCIPWFKGSPASEGEDPEDEDWNPAFGGGYIFRSCSEMILVGTRGTPTLLPARKKLRAAFFSPQREHSRKPDEQYTHAEALSPGPRIELFSRTNRPGWVSFGDQVGLFNKENVDQKNPPGAD